MSKKVVWVEVLGAGWVAKDTSIQLDTNAVDAFLEYKGGDIVDNRFDIAHDAAGRPYDPIKEVSIITLIDDWRGKNGV